MSDQGPKIDKAFLAKVAQHSKSIYLDYGYKIEERYLSSDEIVANAWIQAYLRVLTSKGYEITKTKEPAE